LRVKKVSGSATTVSIFSGGHVIAEYDGSGGLLNEYVFAGGQRIATIPGLQNGGFEQGGQGWSLASGAQVISDASRAHSGSGYTQLSTSSATNIIITPFVRVSTGDQVSFGGWVYRESGTSGYARWNLAAYDANFNGVAYPNPSPNNVTTATWTYQLGNYTIPSNVVYVRVYCEIWGASVATTSRCWTRPPAPTKSTINAAAISKIPERMKASR